jgi:hypothetical protein
MTALSRSEIVLEEKAALHPVSRLRHVLVTVSLKVSL